MPVSPHHANSRGGAPVAPARAAIVAAFLVLYFIWGSTYLAIRIAVATAPPFLLAGLRFAVAGALLLGVRRFRANVPWPTTREWIGGGAVGACLVLLSNVAVVFAEKTIPSGLTALFAAATPLLIALFNRHRIGAPLGIRRLGGLLLGSFGMFVLGGDALRTMHSVAPLLLMALATIAWAIGSTYGRDWGQSTDVMMASGTQMLVGGLLATLVGLLVGEGNWMATHTLTWQSMAAWAYLAIVGSLIAYPVFQWLLSVADATAVASYTYVNPMVAVTLGVLLIGEQVTPRMVIAAAFLIPAVILVVTGAPKAELLVKSEE